MSPTLSLEEAGQWIEKFDRHSLTRIYKDAGSSDASQLVTEVDIRSEEIIRQRLQRISEPLNITTHLTAPYPLPKAAQAMPCLSHW